MTENQIYDRLKTFRLSGMADCWKSLQETHKTSMVSLQDGLTLMLDSEQVQRENSRTSRLIKNARFRYNAIFEDAL